MLEKQQPVICSGYCNQLSQNLALCLKSLPETICNTGEWLYIKKSLQAVKFLHKF